MIFNTIEFIEKKRDGGKNSAQEIRAFVSGIMSGSVPDYQLAAWLMAAYLKGLDDEETSVLTQSLALSGDTIQYPDDIRIVDKHSTGGVGDKTTLVLIPLVASCGAHVSKLSGPGLGYTGGTVDKLEAIPGMELHLSEEKFQSQVRKIGCAISGHSRQLAPAEGKFYKMRDVTGTVASIPLITSSIISKKLAGGADAFIFDVKCGSGAFMRNKEDAAALAKNLVSVSKKLGKGSLALMTDMEQPLGEWIGNAAEVYESISVLKGGGPRDTRELCITLGAYMLRMARICDKQEDGEAACANALDNGAALAKFKELVAAQGGDPSVTDNPEETFLKTRLRHELRASENGCVSKMDALAIGEALRALGGGRIKQEDEIDSSVAIQLCAKVGDRVQIGDVLIRVLYNDKEQLENAAPYLCNCWQISPKAEKRKLILDYFI